ncbi:MAG: glycosyltransferase family 4 protein [Fusobacteriaceae bacterium]|nr:glycosyltransferase family 4 protein [Fusobacteriaceae bacterium]
MKKTFVHVYDELDIVHIGKEHGIYPVYMQELGWDSSIITYDLKKELDEDYRGVKLIKLSPLMPFLGNLGLFKFIKRIPIYWYVYKNAKKIDVLMLFHCTVCSWWNSFFYKLGNPKGIVFVKGDFDKSLYLSETSWLNKDVKNLREFFKKRKWTRAYKKRKELLEICDIYSVETQEGYEELYNNGYVGLDLKGKLLNLPNGVDLKFITDNNIVVKEFSEKENIIFTASRIGDESKNTEFLLDVLEKTDLKDWKVVLAGKINPNLKPKMESFFSKNPMLKEKVIFLDFVKDKNILYSYYNKAKIFVMTSRGEGFANVFLEALYFGTYIITTRVSSATDVTNNCRTGSIVEQGDIKGYVEKLEEAINDNVFLERKYKETREFSKKYVWGNIIEKLSKRISEIG